MDDIKSILLNKKGKDLKVAQPNIRRVMIATPCHDAKVSVYYANSLNFSKELCSNHNIYLFPIYLPSESIISKARNTLLEIASDLLPDDLLWIDSDQEWNPEDLLKLLKHEEDVVGGCCRRKTDEAEEYNIKILSDNKLLRDSSNGLIPVYSMGTAFLKMSKKAYKALHDSSPTYTINSNDSKARLAFENIVIDGEFYSEDTIACKKLRELGFTIWFDPSITIVHIGEKRFVGNFIEYEKKLKTL